MDYLETEYFESALHDLLDESFNMNLREFLIRQMKFDSTTEDNSRESGGESNEALFKSDDEQVFLVKIITFIFVQ